VKAIKQQHPEAYSRLRRRYRFTQKCPHLPEKRQGWGGRRKGEKEKKVIMILINTDKQKEEKMG